MTSFADDNRSILNARKAQYNNSIPVSSESVCREKQTDSARRPSGGDHISAFYRLVDFRKKYMMRKSRENRKAIDEAFKLGANKVNTKYEDYAVKEHNSPVGILAIAFALTIVAIFLLINFSQISKFNDEINRLESEMTEDTKRISELDMLIDKNTDITAVEEYAKSRGMIKADRVETKYVNMSSGYKIEKMPATENEGYTISTAMSGVISLFGEAW